MVFLIIAQVILNPVFQPRENASNLPLQTFCTFVNLSSIKYISLYFIESVGLVCLIFGFIGTDTFFFGIVMHFCGQLDILQRRMSVIGKSKCHTIFVNKITVLIKKHCELIQLTKDINEAFSSILWLQFVMSAFTIIGQCTCNIVILCFR